MTKWDRSTEVNKIIDKFVKRYASQEADDWIRLRSVRIQEPTQFLKEQVHDVLARERKVLSRQIKELLSNNDL